MSRVRGACGEIWVAEGLLGGGHFVQVTRGQPIANCSDPTAVTAVNSLVSVACSDFRAHKASVSPSMNLIICFGCARALLGGLLH